MVDSNPQDGENIRLSGEGPDQSVGKERKMQHLPEKLLTKHGENHLWLVYKLQTIYISYHDMLHSILPAHPEGSIN